MEWQSNPLQGAQGDERQRLPSDGSSDGTRSPKHDAAQFDWQITKGWMYKKSPHILRQGKRAWQR